MDLKMFSAVAQQGIFFLEKQEQMSKTRHNGAVGIFPIMT
jgi:hypothetical protein